MKVLHFLWNGQVGGAQRAVYQLVARQRELPGLEVSVLFGRSEGPYHRRMAELGIPVRSLDRSGSDPRAVIEGARLMRGHDLHHFHSIEPAAFAASLASGRATRVFTERTGRPAPPPDRRKALRYRLGAAMLRRSFHGFSGNTRHATRTGAARFGLDPSRLVTTYNGLDFGLLRPERSRDEVRRALGLDDGFLVGTAAILKPGKRIDRLIDAAVASGIEGLQLLVLGDGPDLESLRRRAANAGFGDRAHFPGTVMDVADAVAALDAFVLPSNDRESFGNAVVEAMALEVPSAVFADSPGIVEHIDDGRTGFVAHDVAGLAEILRRLASDPGLRAATGRAGSAAVRAKYTVDAMVEAYAELYRRAVRARRAS